MKNYFKDCATLEQVRERFIVSVQEVKPGSKTAAALLEQYRTAYETHKADRVNSDGVPYHKEATINADDFAKLVYAVLAMEGVELELVGTWFWASGNTKPYKKELLGLKFWWNKKRQVWQWHDPSEGKYRPSKKSSGLVRIINGSKVIKTVTSEDEAEAVAAG